MYNIIVISVTSKQEPSWCYLSTQTLHTQKEDEQPEDTLKCEKCTEQFSARWNLNNHIRYTNEKTDICKYFKQGRCHYPEEICWHKHDDNDTVIKTTVNIAKNVVKTTSSREQNEEYF